MTKHTRVTKMSQRKISEKDINSLFKKVREFQAVNQKYLIKIPDDIPDVKPTIINMANTNY